MDNNKILVFFKLNLFNTNSFLYHNVINLKGISNTTQSVSNTIVLSQIFDGVLKNKQIKIR